MTKDEALRMAIELMERFLEHDSISSSDYIDVRNACIKALEPTVAELNDEYLRDTYVEGMPKDGNCCTEDCIKCDARKVLAETQEPMTHVIGLDNDGKEVVVKLQTPLYTKPPSREWQSLSDEEILRLEGLDCVDEESIKRFVRAIEAKLREING